MGELYLCKVELGFVRTVVFIMLITNCTRGEVREVLTKLINFR